jgi:outer membrane protein
MALTFGLKNVLSFYSSKLDEDGAEAESGFNFGFGDVANPFGGNASFGLLFVF